MPKVLRLAVVWWVLLFGLYAGLVSPLTRLELAVGAVAAAPAAALATAAARVEPIRYRPRAAWLRWLPLVAGALVADTVRLAVVLGRRLVLRQDVRGRLRTIQLPVTGDERVDSARRALGAAAVSVTPGAYVVDVDYEHNRLLLHELVSGRPRVAEEVGW